MEENPEENGNFSAFDVLNCMQSNENVAERPSEVNQQERPFISYQMFQEPSPSVTDSSHSDSPGFLQHSSVHQPSTSQNMYNNNNEIQFGQYAHHEVPQENYPQQPIVGGYQPVPVETPGPSNVRYNPIQVPSTSAQRQPLLGQQDNNEFDQYFPELRNRPLKVEIEDRPQSSAHQHSHSHSDTGSSVGAEEHQLRPLKFQPFNPSTWHPVCDENGKPSQIQWAIDDIKNCVYDWKEKAFVHYKRTHFQFTARLWLLDQSRPKFVNTGVRIPIKKLKITFYGVKAESQTSIIELKQDRTKTRKASELKAPEPYLFDFDENQAVKAQFERLHFTKSTDDNEVKKAQQGYFLFVVNLHAVTDCEGGERDILVMSYASDRIIVRAGSKIEFEKALAKRQQASSSLTLERIEPKCDGWQCNHGIVSTLNPSVVGGHTPVEGAALTVLGNMFVSGTTSTYSDMRLKRNIKPTDLQEALELLMKLRPVSFEYLPEFAEAKGMENPHRVGYIAQEVQAVLEDAVHQVGDYLAVDEKRICVQGIAATIQLAQMAETMREEIRAHAEQIQSILALGEKRKRRSESMASGLQDDTSSLLSAHGSSKRRIDPHCTSKVAQWSILTAIIILMAIMAIALVSMVFLYFVELRHRYGSPNATWPLTHHRQPPPENMVVPVEKLWYLQKNVLAISPVCHDDHCHSYCCVGTPVENSTKYILEESNATSEVENYIPSLMKTDYVISLPQFNAVLDSRYCIGRSCSSSYGKYHLFVPLSPYMPSTPLRIQFSLTKGKVSKGCGFVTEFQNRLCDSSVIDIRSLKMRQVDENSFDLPVGGLLQSAFRFRVGFASDVCKLSKNSHGFDEIVIHFYRKCK